VADQPEYSWRNSILLALTAGLFIAWLWKLDSIYNWAPLPPFR